MNDIIKQDNDNKLTVMTTAGATREKSWEAIAGALEATKMTLDKFGEEHIEPDHNTRLRAAELIAKATGDIKPDGAVTNNVVTIGISADEFKALLLSAGKVSDSGQSGEIIDVENVRV